MRSRRGTPSGGQFVASERPEPDVLLVEFAPDEAEQVDEALGSYEAALAFTGSTTMNASATAREQVRSMRAVLSGRRPFAAAPFDSEQVHAMSDALEFHRSRAAASPSALAATDAAMFRLDTAGSLAEAVEGATP